MAFTESMLWTTDGTGDGPAGGYSRSRWAELLRSVFGNGVLKGEGDELAVTGSASPLTLATGAAIVDGIFGRNPVAEGIAVPTPSVGTTGHRLVLRATWGNTQTLRPALLSNNDGVSLSVQVPPLTQNSGDVYEIPLAQFNITTAGVIQDLDSRAPLCQFGTDIADGVVTTIKLADGAVTTAKLGAKAVGTAQLADGAVTAAKIPAGAGIEQSKISNMTRAIDAAKLEGKSAGDFAGADCRLYGLQGEDEYAWAIPAPSASYSDVSFRTYGGSNLTTVSFASTGVCDVVVQFSGVLKGAPGAGTLDFRAVIDGVETPAASRSAVFTGALHFCAMWHAFQKPAGAHTVKLQFRHDQGNAVSPGIGDRYLAVQVFPHP